MTQIPNPLNAGAIPTALTWFDSVFLGSLVTAIGILAVAAVGFLMLSGRIDVRRAARVVLGCFIIFGASSIASGIFGAFSGRPAVADQIALSPPPLPHMSPPVSQQQNVSAKSATNPFDPYGSGRPQR